MWAERSGAAALQAAATLRPALLACTSLSNWALLLRCTGSLHAGGCTGVPLLDAWLTARGLARRQRTLHGARRRTVLPQLVEACTGLGATLHGPASRCGKSCLLTVPGKKKNGLHVWMQCIC